MVDRREYLDETEEAVRMALDERLKEVWTAMPGIVQSFNATAMTCVVQPAIKAKVTNFDRTTKLVALPLCLDCPVMFPGGGGVTLTFPVKRGDECLLVFAKSCIDAWWQQGGVQPAAEYRMHDLSDGFALVGVRSKVRALSAVSMTLAQLRTDDGLTFVSLDPTGQIVNITAPGGIVLDGPVAVTGPIVATGTISSALGLYVDGVEVTIP